jgi:hypothetical protein
VTLPASYVYTLPAVAPTSLRGALEDAVVARLTPLLLPIYGGDAGGYLEALTVWAGNESPDTDDEQVLRFLNGRSPAVLVMAGDAQWDRESIGVGTARKTVDILLLVVSQNAGGPLAQVRGDGFSADPGLWAIGEAIDGRLMGWPPGVDFCGPLRPVNESRQEPTEDPRVMFQIRYQTEANLTGYDPDEDGTELNTIRGRINEATDDTANPVISFDHEL